MRLTPLDIRKQEFKKGMRGLDSDEVYAFLTTVADEYEALLNDNKALRERLLELDDKVQEYRNMEKTLRDTLLTAERVTVEAKDNARREAELIIKEAEVEADRGVRSIKENAMLLRQEIQTLKQQRESYLARMRMLAESHLKFLESADRDFLETEQRVETPVAVPAKPSTARPVETSDTDGGRDETTTRSDAPGEPDAPRATETAAAQMMQAGAAPHVDDIRVERPPPEQAPENPVQLDPSLHQPVPEQAPENPAQLDPSLHPPVPEQAPENPVQSNPPVDPPRSQTAPVRVAAESAPPENPSSTLNDLLDRVIDGQKESLASEAVGGATPNTERESGGGVGISAPAVSAETAGAGAGDVPGVGPSEWSLERLKRDILARPSNDDETV